MGEVIYFISDGGASIKIGRSARVGRRMREMQTGNRESFIFLGCTPGGKRHEQKIHQTLSLFRLRGEWFADCEEVRSVINRALVNGITVELPPEKRAAIDRKRGWEPGRLSHAYARLEAACPHHPFLTMPMEEIFALSDAEVAAIDAASIDQMKNDPTRVKRSA